MPVFMILFGIGLIILWFLLSPLFEKIGDLVVRKFYKEIVIDEINNKEEKEN